MHFLQKKKYCIWLKMVKKMNKLKNLFDIEIKKYKDKFLKYVKLDKWRNKYHLMPPIGWINDPNGLCQLNGKYHIFYQYSPLDAKNGLKFWGHYTTRDFINYNDEDIFLYPDQSFDKSGVYSGSAIIKNKEIYIFYTGNVKEEGEFDYINFGRQHNTIMVKYDGYKNISLKKVILKNEDYTSNLSLHVRDPQILRKDDIYYMVLGARTKENKGVALIYKSFDLDKWVFMKEINSEYFGYMWECPNIVFIENKMVMIFSPQGLKKEKYKFQNIYQSGYIILEDNFLENDSNKIDVSRFVELDVGFDFYAPQVFIDEKGRIILIAWLGLPDEEKYINPTIENYWQHQLSLPRELYLKNNKIYQKPLEEFKNLRNDFIEIRDIKLCNENIEFDIIQNYSFEMSIDINSDEFIFTFRDIDLIYKNKEFIIKIGKSGYGRDKRYVKIDIIDNLNIFSDNSSVEIFINYGEKVLSTRIYNEDIINKIKLCGKGNFNIKKWNLKNIQINNV